MNIKVMRSIHLYLGCFFAPLLMFFIITGCWQTFELHELKKSSQGYQPPKVVEALSEVHMHQRVSGETVRPKPSMPLKYFILLMSLGVALTTVLGILMAFKFTRPFVVWGCLLLGSLVPVLLLWAARGAP